MTLFGLPDRADQAIYQCQLVAISNEISDLIRYPGLQTSAAIENKQSGSQRGNDCNTNEAKRFS